MRVRDVISKMQTPSIRIDFVYCGWGRRFMMRKRHQEKYYTAEMIMVGFHYKHIHFSIFDWCCWCWALPHPLFSRQTLPSYTYDRLIEIEMPIWIFINPPSLHSQAKRFRGLCQIEWKMCAIFVAFFPNTNHVSNALFTYLFIGIGSSFAFFNFFKIDVILMWW